MIHDFGFVVLELSPSEPQDTGKWTCRATNRNGSDEVSCDLKVGIFGALGSYSNIYSISCQ